MTPLFCRSERASAREEPAFPQSFSGVSRKPTHQSPKGYERTVPSLKGLINFSRLTQGLTTPTRAKTARVGDPGTPWANIVSPLRGLDLGNRSFGPLKTLSHPGAEAQIFFQIYAAQPSKDRLLHGPQHAVPAHVVQHVSNVVCQTRKFIRRNPAGGGGSRSQH
jgi:hypothetical protein